MTKEERLNSVSVKNARDEELICRAYDVLLGNVYPKEGYPWSPYRCITPGINWFRGIWNWDSAFHAVGISQWDVQIAKECILGFLQYQREDGLLPDVIFEDGRKIDSFGKPPLFAWATEFVYKHDKDVGFLKEVYPKLVYNLLYLEEHRCCGGLFLYDADDKEAEDYLTRVKYESGWDNSVRWDKGITEYWPIDLNCFMVMFYRSLSFIASELGIEDECKKWCVKANDLSNMINQKMWDSKNCYYADTNRFTEEVSDVLTPASFMPLYINIAAKEQAKAMEIIAREKFKSKMPTVSFDNPKYSTDYWRGPTWINVAYFAAKGLKNYGFEVADKIKENILNMCYNEKGGIYENYDSVTGEGFCCNHFSWSSVFIMEFILNF